MTTRTRTKGHHHGLVVLALFYFIFWSYSTLQHKSCWSCIRYGYASESTKRKFINYLIQFIIPHP